jgi:Raf kinase inhibitor-like YbhB/YbcL family protein
MGTWVHWVVYNIPPDTTKLPEAVPAKEILENGIMQGISSWKKTGYGGPCPPSGTHRYFFKVYAVDITIDIKPGKATKEAILKAIENHVLAKGELMGKYKRQ